MWIFICIECCDLGMLWLGYNWTTLLLLITIMTTVFTPVAARALSTFLKPGRMAQDNRMQILFNSLLNVRDKIESICDPTFQTESDFSDCINAMNAITLEDVGIDIESLRSLRLSICMDVCSTPLFDIAVFVIPEGGNIPLHDHPNMAVFSRLLYGQIKTTSFTPKENKDGCIIASPPTIVTRSVTDMSWYLTPHVNNIHEFAAVSLCVVFDVLLPPYIDPDRPCNFYKAEEVTAETWKLSKTPFPTSSLPYTVAYGGLVPKRG